mmetsp:Transcript_704/g.872  ORF Transcript_704/g.872 Transcript_704/m.872 type:complete len:335 (+) Transcript_704:106-1110(+)
MAVSILSPVSTHTLIPAAKRSWIAAGTPSCSLSSTAVLPTRSKSTSMSSAAAATLDSRSTKETHASFQIRDHVRYSSSGISRCASTSVRYPTFDISSKCRCRLSRWGWSGFSRGMTVASAPFVKRTMREEFSEWDFFDIFEPAEVVRHKSDMRLRSLLNSKTAKTSKSSRMPCESFEGAADWEGRSLPFRSRTGTRRPALGSGSESGIEWEFMLWACHVRRSMDTVSAVRETSRKPKAAAPMTNASSSGELAWYSKLPSGFLAGTTVLHKARFMQYASKSRMGAVVQLRDDDSSICRTGSSSSSLSLSSLSLPSLSLSLSCLSSPLSALSLPKP